MSHLRGNPTALTLLQAGCTIILPSGYRLRGDPETSYICCEIDAGGEVAPDGLRQLDRQGVNLGLMDASEFESSMAPKKDQNPW
jgi:hypothetical protein